MARNGTGADEPSEAERRDLITPIRRLEPLPETYRFMLPGDKREVEVVRNGKMRDAGATVILEQIAYGDDACRASRASTRRTRAP